MRTFSVVLLLCLLSGVLPQGRVNFSGQADISSDEVTYNWSVTGLTNPTFTCNFNNGPSFECQPGYSVPLANLKEGPNVLMVIAMASDGTIVGPLTLTATRPATPAPIAALDLSESVEDEAIVFRWMQTKGASYTCSLNGEPERSCSPGEAIDISSLPSGANVFVVKAYVNNQLQATATSTISIQSPPPPPVPIDLTAQVLGPLLSFSWTPMEGVMYTCQLDSGQERQCSPTHQLLLATLSPGDHNLVVRAYIDDALRGTATSTFNVPAPTPSPSTASTSEASATSTPATSVDPSTEPPVVDPCSVSGISNISRRYVWPEGFAVFNWETFGNVEETRCRLDNGEEEPCNKTMRYNVMTVLAAGKHQIEVVPYCNGAALPSKQRNFRSQSGIPSDPENCARMEVQSPRVTYSPSLQTVSIGFNTSTPASCVCKLPGKIQVKRECQSGHVFTGIANAAFNGRKRPKIAIFCRSVDCGVKQMFPVYFDIPRN